MELLRRLDDHGLTRRVFEVVNAALAYRGLTMPVGIMVNAAMVAGLVAAAPSTKNAEKRRDLEMQDAKKNKQWVFVIGAHVGVSTVLRLAHCLTSIAAHMTDIIQAD